MRPVYESAQLQLMYFIHGLAVVEYVLLALTLKHWSVGLLRHQVRKRQGGKEGKLVFVR